MTNSFDKSQIELPSDTKSTGGRYDELLEAGMATRFVKGTSGNPNGRSKGRRIEKGIRDLLRTFGNDLRASPKWRARIARYDW